MACHMGNEEIAHELISNGANVHAQTSVKKDSMLHAAVAGGSIPIIDELLKNGVDIEINDVDHRTPIHR